MRKGAHIEILTFEKQAEAAIGKPIVAEYGWARGNLKDQILKQLPPGHDGAPAGNKQSSMMQKIILLGR
jgi:hypothetical protein